MSELSMLLQYQQLSADTFARWVYRYYGDPGVLGSHALAQWVLKRFQPHPVDGLRVIEFDLFLMRPEVEDGEFTRAMIELRNAFARNANMSIPQTVTLEPAAVEAPPEAPSRVQLSFEPAEILARLLCAQGRERATRELSDAFETYAFTARGHG